MNNVGKVTVYGWLKNQNLTDTEMAKAMKAGTREEVTSNWGWLMDKVCFSKKEEAKIALWELAHTCSDPTEEARAISTFRQCLGKGQEGCVHYAALGNRTMAYVVETDQGKRLLNRKIELPFHGNAFDLEQRINSLTSTREERYEGDRWPLVSLDQVQQVDAQAAQVTSERKVKLERLAQLETAAAAAVAAERAKAKKAEKADPDELEKLLPPPKKSAQKPGKQVQLAELEKLGTFKDLAELKQLRALAKTWKREDQAKFDASPLGGLMKNMEKNDFYLGDHHFKANHRPPARIPLPMEYKLAAMNEFLKGANEFQKWQICDWTSEAAIEHMIDMTPALQNGEVIVTFNLAKMADNSFELTTSLRRPNAENILASTDAVPLAEPSPHHAEPEYTAVTLISANGSMCTRFGRPGDVVDSALVSRRRGQIAVDTALKFAKPPSLADSIAQHATAEVKRRKVREKLEDLEAKLDKREITEAEYYAYRDSEEFRSVKAFDEFATGREDKKNLMHRARMEKLKLAVPKSVDPYDLEGPDLTAEEAAAEMARVLAETNAKHDARDIAPRSPEMERIVNQMKRDRAPHNAELLAEQRNRSVFDALKYQEALQQAIGRAAVPVVTDELDTVSEVSEDNRKREDSLEETSIRETSSEVRHTVTSGGVESDPTSPKGSRPVVTRQLSPVFEDSQEHEDSLEVTSVRNSVTSPSVTSPGVKIDQTSHQPTQAIEREVVKTQLRKPLQPVSQQKGRIREEFDKFFAHQKQQEEIKQFFKFREYLHQQDDSSGADEENSVTRSGHITPSVTASVQQNDDENRLSKAKADKGSAQTLANFEAPSAQRRDSSLILETADEQNTATAKDPQPRLARIDAQIPLSPSAIIDTEPNPLAGEDAGRAPVEQKTKGSMFNRLMAWGWLNLKSKLFVRHGEFDRTQQV